MIHPWREHIQITKDSNPNIKNFGEIIKLAKNTYKKKNEKNVKKTLKKGGGKVFADRVDNKGEQRRYQALKEGECIFPFKYNNKLYNECADSKDGKWCATELKKDGSLKASHWGYCETHFKKEQNKEEVEEYSDTQESDSENEGEEQEFAVYPIEYGEEKYLLDKNTRNVYSYPDKKGNYIFIGKALPNEEIDFDAIEYIPEKKNIEEEKNPEKLNTNKSTSSYSSSTKGGGKYGVYNENITILEKFGEIYRIRNSKGETFLTDKKNIFF